MEDALEFTIVITVPVSNAAVEFGGTVTPALT
jgi:hypothetical protein